MDALSALVDAVVGNPINLILIAFVVLWFITVCFWRGDN